MRDMRLLIRRLAEQGMTVLLSSHLLAEVEERLQPGGDRAPGRIVYEGEIAELKRGAGTRYRLQTTDDERALAVCQAQPGIADVRTEHGQHLVHRRRGRRRRPLSQALVESGALIHAHGAPDGHARGPVLLAHRGRRRPARRGGARRAPEPAGTAESQR